ncbi:MAG: hypothetical protein JW726_16590 [Anaerolineales bacterium]|nr:hypothetical protein [Anaerolineales bacterium]
MPKEFYTEKDIEDLVKRGIMSLDVNENVVLTDLAYEKARRLGMRLVSDRPENPPAAPSRPYLSQKWNQPHTGPEPSPSSQTQQEPAPIAAPQTNDQDLHQRIRNAVLNRLGNQIDSDLLDVIIQRVLDNTGVK